MAIVGNQKPEAGIRLRLRQLIYEKSIAEGRDITQAEIAEDANIRRPTVSKWMDNKRLIGQLDVDTLIKLARSLDVHPMELIEFVGLDWIEEDTDPESEPSLLEIA